MITFSIEYPTIASLQYLLILINSVILIALVYFVSIMRESNKYIKGIGCMATPPNMTFCSCGKVKPINEIYNCVEFAKNSIKNASNK